jgi:hypothetical protein
MLLERNENRINFKLEITKFFMDWDFSKGPMYPFHKKDMIDIIAGIKQKIKEFTPQLQYVDYHTFGETVIFGFSWEGEGVSVEVNINPVSEENKDKFRALFRWR